MIEGVQLNPTSVNGNWRSGWTLDVHTISSIPIGRDENGNERFETLRSELGERVFQLKYRDNHSEAIPIAEAMADFLHRKPNTLTFVDVIIPVPPSTQRAIQPVNRIAIELGSRIQKPVLTDAIWKNRDTPCLKNIPDRAERLKLLDGIFDVNSDLIQFDGILVIDDLYDTGVTANAVAHALKKAGASRIFFLAATRTRSNQ